MSECDYLENTLINKIQRIIDTATKQIFDNPFKVQIFYKYNDDKYYTVIAFKICSELNKLGIKIKPVEVADKIIKGIKRQTGIRFQNSNGYINIYIDSKALNNEIEYISEAFNQRYEVKDEMPFLMQYMVCKIKSGIKYLWSEESTIKVYESEKCIKLALLVIQLCSNRERTKSELCTLTKNIYEYDRSLTGIQAPVSLYKAYLKAILPN